MGNKDKGKSVEFRSKLSYLLCYALALVQFQQLYGNPHHHNNQSSSLRFSNTRNCIRIFISQNVSNTVAEQDFTYENLEVAKFFPNEIEQTIQTYREMLRQSLDEKFLIIGFKQNQTETGFFTKKNKFLNQKSKILILHDDEISLQWNNSIKIQISDTNKRYIW